MSILGIHGFASHAPATGAIGDDANPSLARRAAARVRDAVTDVVTAPKSIIDEHPVPSLLLLGAVGFAAVRTALGAGIAASRLVYPAQPLNAVMRVGGSTSQAVEGSKHLRMLVIGDSLAQGIGVRNAEHSIAGYTARHLVAHTGQDIHVQSLGKVNRHITGTMRQLQRSEPGNDLVMVMVGSNDALQGVPLRSVERRYGKLLGEIRRKNPDAHIVAVGVPDIRDSVSLPGLASWVGDKRGQAVDRRIRAAISDSGDPKVSYVDMRAKFSGTISRRELSSDGFHMREVGYGRIGKAVAAQIASEWDIARPPRSQTHRLDRTAGY